MNGTCKNLSRIMINEAVESLTLKPIKSTTFDRVCLYQRADSMFGALPRQERYSKTVYYLLENCKTPVEPHDLILGRIEDRVLTDEEEVFFQSVKHNECRPDCFRDSGHRSFDWKALVDKGLCGLKTEALAQLKKRETEGNKNKIEFLKGVITIYDGLMLYARRYAEAARKLGLEAQAETLDAIAENPPATFRQALQLLWLVQLVYCSYIAGNPSLSYGRFDLILEELYNRDRKGGRLSLDEARLLILDYYCKNNLIMGRGEHQMSAVDPEKVTGWARNLCYDSPQYLVIGGHRYDGTVLNDELTHLLAETVVPAFKNPVILVHYSENMQTKCKKLWLTLVDKMRQSASMMIYNEKAVISGFEYIGVPREEAATFEHYGCNHPTLPAIERLIRYDGIVPVALFNEILHKWAEDGYEPTSTDELYDALTEAVKRQAIEIILRLKERYENELKGNSNALEFADAFQGYTVAAAASLKGEGSKYFFTTFIFACFASLVDSVTAVDTLVIKQKKFTLARLMEALKANFEGYPKEYALCKNAPKLGSDHAVANAHARALMIRFTDEVKALADEILPKAPTVPVSEGNPVSPIPLIRFSTESDNGHIDEGIKLGATPDGRLRGMPLAQNSAPAVGSSINGITARLASIASIPFDRFTAGAQNLSIQKSAFAGDEGLLKLAAILGGYFDMGGLQLQVTATDLDSLRAAQKDPDAHRDLMVRITGYSAVFCDLTEDAQNDIIRREEMC